MLVNHFWTVQVHDYLPRVIGTNSSLKVYLFWRLLQGLFICLKKKEGCPNVDKKILKVLRRIRETYCLHFVVTLTNFTFVKTTAYICKGPWTEFSTAVPNLKKKIAKLRFFFEYFISTWLRLLFKCIASIRRKESCNIPYSVDNYLFSKHIYVCLENK